MAELTDAEIETMMRRFLDAQARASQRMADNTVDALLAPIGLDAEAVRVFAQYIQRDPDAADLTIGGAFCGGFFMALELAGLPYV